LNIKRNSFAEYDITRNPKIKKRKVIINTDGNNPINVTHVNGETE